MERDVVEPIALLVGKEDHGISLPLVCQVKRSAFLLAVVRRTALHNGVDGHVAFGLEGKRIVGRIGKPLGRLQLQAPRRIRKFSHRHLHAFAAVDAEAHLAELQVHLRRAVRIIPQVPTAIAVRHVAVCQHVLRHQRGSDKGRGRTRKLHTRKIHKDLAFSLKVICSPRI